MSDFKYAAINEAIKFSKDGDSGAVGQVIEGVVLGTVPVVDVSSVWLFAESHFDRFRETANAFVKAISEGAVRMPLERLMAYFETTGTAKRMGVLDGYRVASVVSVLVGEKCHMEVVHTQVMMSPSGKTVCAHIGDSGDERPFMAMTTAVLFCMASWMTVKNSVVVDATAERHYRRRYAPLASVRFRRVFITPMRRSASGLQPELYEITGDHCPLHHVRGHIRHVSEERPLFGRKGAHGTFWISEHWRGDEENGRIIHEYVPQPPEEP